MSRRRFLLSAVDVRSPLDEVRGFGEPIWKAQYARGCLRTCGLTGPIVPKTGLVGSHPLGLLDSVLSLRCLSGRRWQRHLARPPGARPLDPHAMEYDADLASERHLGIFCAPSHSGAQGPSLESREPRSSAKNAVGCLIKRGTHHRITRAGDRSCAVCLARLILSGSEPESNGLQCGSGRRRPT